MRGTYSAWFNGSVGQLSDPYQQGEDDEEGITISGLPGDLLEPELPSGPVADAQLADDEDEDDEAVDEGLSGESITYDLEDWSDLERQAITERLREAGVPHGWEGPQLLIAAVDEGVVENILDIVEGESADEAAEPLDPERDQMAYGVEELEDEELDALADALRAAGISYAWGDDELYVYADDEAAVDEVFDTLQHPDELAPEDDESPKGTATADLLGDVFVAADRLQHDAEDTEGTSSLLNIALTIDDLEAPYGMGARDWESVCAAVGRLADVLAEDTVDEDKVTETAREVRAVMRPYV
jgi:hypothetical protein